MQQLQTCMCHARSYAGHILGRESLSLPTQLVCSKQKPEFCMHITCTVQDATAWSVASAETNAFSVLLLPFALSRLLSF